jgi:hypothetical protein
MASTGGAAREPVDGDEDNSLDAQGKAKPRKTPVPFTDAMMLLLANTISDHYGKYSAVLVPGSHNKTNQLQEMVKLINDHLKDSNPLKNLYINTKILTQWINTCIQSVPDWQQEAEQENTDGGDKKSGADNKIISEHKAALIELIAHHSIEVQNAPAKKQKTTSVSYQVPSSSITNEVCRTVSVVVEGARDIQEAAEQQVIV